MPIGCFRNETRPERHGKPLSATHKYSQPTFSVLSSFAFLPDLHPQSGKRQIFSTQRKQSGLPPTV
jgi:hypothetical protein